jgi:hypothetical protein
MDYSQVFSTYEDYSAAIDAGAKDFVRAIPYVDFAKAVFGCRRIPASSGLGSLEPGTPEYDAALAAALPTSELLVWMKFGRELTEVPTTFGTLAELNAVALVDPPLVTYRLSGIPSAVDYKDAATGTSRTYTVDLTGYRKTPRELTIAALSQYRALDWPFLVGVKDASLIPATGPAFRSVRTRA